ncbi:MAG: phosphoribosyl-AMP cyclohydrolase [Nitrospinae bacterium]|nr:phosphoribosyl-AMP cyclohydrolase [Nitrospinota bacterium]
MEREYFLALEKLKNNSSLALNEVLEQLAFNEQGLIPVITQDAKTKTMLMFAWMNIESLQQTLATKKMTYWSRSRQQLWVKGETSGHLQRVFSMSFDCDGDAILCQVEQQGAPCHTGRQSCFYLNVEAENQQVIINEDHA